jgi:predicted nucleic acid-binding protein
VLDTTVLIKALRDPDAWEDLFEAMTSERVWLSSVVVAELYAGTRSPDDGRAIAQIVRSMSRLKRVFAPMPEEWARAGQLIARRIRLQGELSPRDHLADVLIVITAARLGGTVVTANVRHFEAWVGIAASAGLDVTVSAYRP